METPSLRRRALAAVGLLVGFYVLSLGLVAALIAASVVTIAAGEFIGLLIGTTVVTTFAVLPAVFALDRRARDAVREGCVPLSRADQPDLWALVDDIAAATSSAAPSTLLLTAEANAGVLQSGSFLGLRAGRRVMLIGLPLMSLMTEPQLRAVLAHEFGHYQAGDTQVGAVLYRASVGLSRAVTAIRRPVIRGLFEDYAKLYARVSFPIRRAQEINADVFAVRATSGEDLRDALMALPGITALWAFHLQVYVVPTWENGWSIVDPFTPLTAQWSGRHEITAAALEAALARPGEQYDSHPSLAERLATLPERTAAPVQEVGCLHLLKEGKRLEAALRRNFTPPAARAFARREITFAELPGELGSRLGQQRAEALLRPLETMPRATPGTAPGSLAHVLELLESGEAGTIRMRVSGAAGIKAAEADAVPIVGGLLRSTLGYALTQQGLAHYTLSTEGAAAFDVEQHHKAPLDLGELSIRAVQGGADTAAVRKILLRRKVDLGWVLPSRSSAGVADLAAQIGRR